MWLRPVSRRFATDSRASSPALSSPSPASSSSSSSLSSSHGAAPLGQYNKEDVTRAHTYCTDLVRKFDADGYLATLMLPSKARPIVIALRALNIEVARVRDAVKEISIGHMRMRFWKDNVDAAFAGKPSKQPVSLALASVLPGSKLSKMFVMRLIQERDERLGEPPFYTIKDLEQYGENTQSTLLYLTLQAMGINNVHADHAASHAGKALGIVTQLRALPFHLSRQRLMIPLDMAAKHKFVENDIARGNLPPQFSDAVFDMATLGNDHLITARSFKQQVPSEAASALLPAILAEDFLQRLEKADFDIFQGKLHRRNGFIGFKLVYHSILKTY